MKSFLIFLISSSTVMPIVKDTQLKGVYCGYWGRSTWVYSFNGNGKYKLETTGHIGDIEIYGNYQLLGDTALLFSNLNDNDPKRKLILVGDSCLVEVNEPKYVYYKIENDPYETLIRRFKNKRLTPAQK